MFRGWEPAAPVARGVSGCVGGLRGLHVAPVTSISRGRELAAPAAIATGSSGLGGGANLCRAVHQPSVRRWPASPLLLLFARRSTFLSNKASKVVSVHVFVEPAALAFACCPWTCCSSRGIRRRGGVLGLIVSTNVPSTSTVTSIICIGLLFVAGCHAALFGVVAFGLYGSEPNGFGQTSSGQKSSSTRAAVGIWCATGVGAFGCCILAM